jgi:transcriptional regulator with XRE-family HTH domain
MSRQPRPPDAAPRGGGGIHPVDRHVGQVMRARRRALQLSQTAVADRLGVSFQQLQKYERGTNRISASALHTLSLALDLPVARFFDGLPEPGGADDGGRDLIAEMIAAPEGPALAEAFLSLPPGPIRNRLTALARAIGVRG